MEVVIEYESLPGANNEPVVKELAIAAKDVVHTYHFQAPYHMQHHGSDENGLNLGDGSVEYDKLETVLSKRVSNYAPLYASGASKCKFISHLINRTVLNLEVFRCPTPVKFVPEHRCWLPCHKFPNMRCSSKTLIRFTNG
jgi:hypothetical protein